MNKLLYRIVFNKARGMLMVVSELARGCSGSAPSSGISRNHQRLICRIGAISLSLWLASGAITVQAAGIVADQSAPNKQQATIISTANGTPQVNIQTPSAGGVSRNTYSRFDVGQNGVILNNSHKNTATQLGGMVAASFSSASTVRSVIRAADALPIAWISTPLSLKAIRRLAW